MEQVTRYLADRYSRIPWSRWLFQRAGAVVYEPVPSQPGAPRSEQTGFLETASRTSGA